MSLKSWWSDMKRRFFNRWSSTTAVVPPPPPAPPPSPPPSPPPPPPPTAAVIYDTSIGNGVDTAGFASLPKRPTVARNFYVNSATGTDSGATVTTAQNPATPVATFAKAMTFYTDGVGDRILVAENTTYAASVDFSFLVGGFSALYPAVVQSYDVADPTNEAKMGRANGTGSHARPTFTVPFGWVGSSLKSNIVLRGLNINPGNISAQGSQSFESGSGLLFENCLFQFNQLSITIDSQPQLARNWIFRNCAFHGQYWTDSYGQGLYLSGGWGATIEDCVFYHCGYKEGVSRDDVHDGATVFAHSFYQQHPTKATVRRCVFIEGAADGGSSRDDTSSQYNLYIRCPIGQGLGGGNGYDVASPFGNALEARFNAFLEANDINTANHRGIGMSVTNGKTFSRIDYTLMAHCITAGTSGYGIQVGGICPANSYINIDRVTFWSQTALSNHTIDTVSYANSFATTTNCVWDDATSGSNTNKGSVSVPNSAFDVAALVTAASYPDYNSMVQDLIANPEAHKQRTLLSLTLAAYSVSTAPALIDVAMETAFRTGNQDAGIIVGTQEGVTLTTSGSLPPGFSLSSDKRMWFIDGSATVANSGSFNLIQTRASDSATKTTVINWTMSLAPQLSAQSASGTGTTTGTGHVDTTIGNGTLYWVLDTASHAKAFPGEVKAGHDFNFSATGVSFAKSGSQPVSASGTQTISFTGLVTGTTYRLFTMQVSAGGIWSATTDGAHTIAYSSFTTS